MDAIIGVEATARIIELLIGGQLADTFRGGETLPTIHGLRRAAAAAPELRLTWETDTQPGEHYSYIVQASTDSGKTWLTLAVGLTKSDYIIDRSNFQGSRQVQIRVIVTNGFTQSLLTSETFEVADHQ